jgi:predicted ATPase/class 3 adenylate cyclase
MASPPTGTVTFLFTDVEGSTRQAQADPAGWSAARTRHDEIVRSAIEENGGFVFRVVGDAFLTAFSKADSAVTAAATAQRRLQGEPWPGPPVRARMGLHSGVAEWQETDYEGYLTLAHAQRVLGLAYGGQVLLSQTAAELALSNLPRNVTFRDLGTHRLKDLARAEHLFQLVAPDLALDFPPLKSLDARPNNLPLELTSFIGRERELSDLRDLLSTNRLITLTGPGGTGKTRLAMRLAAELLARYDDGVWLVELAPLGDQGLLTQAVAATLGVQEEPGRSSLDSLTDYLRPKTMLLVMDNCEHLIDACAQFADNVLRGSPGLKVVATSRESLGISGETIFRVPSLALPDPLQTNDYERTAANDSVRLFVDRARAANPRFELTDDNAPVVAQICTRLDGIPLAIELAAARTKVFSPEQIASRLDDRFGLLTGGSRTALERHQTLLALIDWSHDLLSDAERTLVRRLSVFAGGWSLAAAEAVCGDEGHTDVVETLIHLADKSLVVVDDAVGAAEPRYRLLETIRQYARDKLLAAGESKRIRDSHLDFYLRLVEEAEPHLRSGEQLTWLDRLETEHDNLRAALSWSLESGAIEHALRLAGAAAYFWELRGLYWSEGQKWLDETLARAQPADTGADEAGVRARAKALYGAARLHFDARIELTSSRALAEESLQSWRDLGDKWWAAVALEHIGFMLMWESDVQTARARLEEGVSLARELGDRWPLAMCLTRLAGAVVVTDATSAHRIREEAVLIARDVGDMSVLSQALVGLAFIYVIEGNVANAMPLAAEALADARAIGTVTQIFLSLLALAVISGLQSDRAAATGYCRELFSLGRSTGSTAVLLVGLMATAVVACFTGEAALGVRLMSAGERLADERGVTSTIVRAILRPLYQPAMQAAQAQLDPTALAAAQESGRTLTLEQAVELATAA